MENSNLNKAHYYNRKAENHLKYKRFEEAIECQQKTIDYLSEAMSQATVIASLQSLKLQYDHHVKYIEFIRLKSNQYEKYKKAVELQKQHNLNVLKNVIIPRNKNDLSNQLQIDIIKKMKATDTLLDLLVKFFSTSSDKSPSSPTNTTSGCGSSGGGADNDNGNTDNTTKQTDGQIYTTQNDRTAIRLTKLKIRTNDSDVIHELKILNQELQILIYELSNQLDESEQERKTLRERISVLEKLKDLQPASTVAGDNTESIVESIHKLEFKNDDYDYENSLKLFTHGIGKINEDDDDAETDEHVSLNDDLRSETVSARYLPPLELPKFDYTTLDK